MHTRAGSAFVKHTRPGGIAIAAAIRNWQFGTASSQKLLRQGLRFSRWLDRVQLLQYKIKVLICEDGWQQLQCIIWILRCGARPPSLAAAYVTALPQLDSIQRVLTPCNMKQATLFPRTTGHEEYPLLNYRLRTFNGIGSQTLNCFESQ